MRLLIAALLINLGLRAYARGPAGQNIILILVDGYGAELLNKTKSSQMGLKQIIENGVQADYVKSVFPTQNWPTWMSLSTGLYVENHGFTAQYMWNERKDITFEQGIGPNDTDYSWWRDLPAPLWYTAGKNNVDIHCYWFAHCHRAYYDMVVQVPSKRVTDVSDPMQTEKIADVFPEMIKRITKYQNYKQQMFLIRYAGIENALRQYGSNSDDTEQALSLFDLHMHSLQQMLTDNDLHSTTNLIVMSSYGLGPVDEEQNFYLEECLSDYSKVIKVVNSHSMLMIFTDPEDEGDVHFELRVCDQWAPVGDYEDESTNVKVHKLSELPEELHWKNSRYMSGVVLITKPGTTVITTQLPSVPLTTEIQRDIKMTSGWEPDQELMKGIFMARGPAFKVNEKHEYIELVDVYQCLLNILGIDPAHPNNGTWDNVGRMMTDGWESRSSPTTLYGLLLTAISSLVLFLS